MRTAFEELQLFIQVQLRQQSAILIREFARGAPLKPKGYGGAMAKPRFEARVRFRDLSYWRVSKKAMKPIILLYTSSIHCYLNFRT